VYSRTDHERVIKLLLATLLDGDEPPVVLVDRDDLTVAWTAAELAAADRYRLEVTTRPGGWGHPPGPLPDPWPPTGRPPPPPTLELRLVPDDGWDPASADDVPEDGP
jgi:hypothetical protein